MVPWSSRCDGHLSIYEVVQFLCDGNNLAPQRVIVVLLCTLSAHREKFWRQRPPRFAFFLLFLLLFLLFAFCSFVHLCRGIYVNKYNPFFSSSSSPPFLFFSFLFFSFCVCFLNRKIILSQKYEPVLLLLLLLLHRHRLLLLLHRPQIIAIKQFGYDLATNVSHVSSTSLIFPSFLMYIYIYLSIQIRWFRFFCLFLFMA